MKHGGLFEGYGGTSRAAETALGVTFDTRWVSDIKPASELLIAERFPGVPNLGDIREIDWSAVEPVEVVTASWPCQPHSAAGKRLGALDPRDLWPEVERAVRALRPQRFFGENVARIVTNGELDRVVGFFAEVGYVVSWKVLAASSVGAPHKRERCYVTAFPDS